MSSTETTVTSVRSRLARVIRKCLVLTALGVLAWTVINSSRQPLSPVGVQRWERSQAAIEHERQEKARQEALGTTTQSSSNEPLGVVQYFVRGFLLLLKIAPYWLWWLALSSALVCSPFVLLASFWMEGFNFTWASWAALVIVVCGLHRYFFLSNFWLIWLHLLALPSWVTFAYLNSDRA